MKLSKALCSVSDQCILIQIWVNFKALPETDSTERAGNMLCFLLAAWGPENLWSPMRSAVAVIMLHFVYNGPLKWSQCLRSSSRTMESQILSEINLDVTLRLIFPAGFIPAEWNYNIWKKECLAIKAMFATWHQYLEKPGIQSWPAPIITPGRTSGWPITSSSSRAADLFPTYRFQDPLDPECPELVSRCITP